MTLKLNQTFSEKKKQVQNLKNIGKKHLKLYPKLFLVKQAYELKALKYFFLFSV
jgi:hypothetical protein